ncbi:MAG: sulfotransferase [Desulfovibrionaceae bacterium]
METPRYAFVLSTGRCGTTSLGILLRNSSSVLALNEGQLRGADLGGEQVLKALTLQNLQAYLAPKNATSLLAEARGQQIQDALKRFKKSYFIEIAYYLAPFTAALHSLYPDAKFLYLHRDGRSFVRSVYTDLAPDPMPVGYVDDRPLSMQERFVALGRLRPRQDSELHHSWEHLPPFERNAWLWAETNRLILDNLQAVPEAQQLSVPMQALFSLDSLGSILNFFDINDINERVVAEATTRRINARPKTILPPWQEWPEEFKARFKTYGQAMLERLGYVTNDLW